MNVHWELIIVTLMRIVQIHREVIHVNVKQDI